jgi:hypothetical protein
MVFPRRERVALVRAAIPALYEPALYIGRCRDGREIFGDLACEAMETVG